MEIPTFIFMIALIWFFYNQGQKEGEDREKRRSFNERMDMLYPFIVKEYGLLTAKVYSKHNCEDLDEAREEAIRAINKSDLGFIHAEKAEIWNEGELLETHLTKERLPINKIPGFSLDKYDGEIKPENYKPFDPESIEGYNYLKVRLTNGDIVRFTEPHYSLHRNSIMGKFGAEFSPHNKGHDFRIIPLRIIDSLIS